MSASDLPPRTTRLGVFSFKIRTSHALFCEFCNHSSMLEKQPRFSWTVPEVSAWTNDYIPLIVLVVIISSRPNRDVSVAKLRKRGPRVLAESWPLLLLNSPHHLHTYTYIYTKWCSSGNSFRLPGTCLISYIGFTTIQFINSLYRLQSLMHT